MQFEQFLGRLKGVKSAGGNTKLAFCPGHNNTNTQALHVSPANDRILLKCFAGCAPEDITGAMGLKLDDLFYVQRNGHSATTFTIDELAEAKGFDLAFLSKMGVTQDKGAVVFHYLLMSGQRAPRQRLRLALSGDKRFLWNKGDGKPVPYGLWQLEAWRKEQDTLILCEGETDALTFWHHGMAALGIPGADNCQLLQLPHVRLFPKIIICRENDQGGETFEKGCIGRLGNLDYDGSIRVVECSHAGVKDANELHLKLLGDAGGFEAEWGALLEQARAVELQRTGLEIFEDSMIERKEVHWLWPNRIPLGKLVLYVGHPGLGKSFAALDLVAHLTNGADWPDEIPNSVKADSIVFSAEDSMADTIIPRLEALGAVKGHTRLVRRTKEADQSGQIVKRAFSIRKDLPLLEKALDRHPATKLIVVDPISAYMSNVDTHKNAEVRIDVLDPLAELAERRNVTVLAVTHFNKGASGNSLERVSGSIAFPAAARIVWTFTRDPEDHSRRLMLQGKNNIGPEMDGLEFRIISAENGAATIAWKHEPITEKFESIMRREQESARGEAETMNKVEQTCDWLREVLRNDSLPVADLESRARAMNISERTLNRARKMAGVKVRRDGNGWTAFLEGSQGCHIPT